MADFLRLVWWTLFCIFCAVHTPRVEAQTVVDRYKINVGAICGPGQTPYVGGAYTGCYPLATTPQQACADFQYWTQQETTPNPYGVTWTSNTTYLAPTAGAPYGQCFRDGTSAQYGPTFGDYTATIVRFTVTSTDPPITCNAGQPSRPFSLTNGNKSLPKMRACEGSCVVSGAWSACVKYGNPEKETCIVQNPVTTGEQCAGEPVINSNGDATSNTLPPGMCPGEVNGTAVLVPCTNITSKDTTTTTTVSGSSTTTLNRQGSTVCNQYGCTTTYDFTRTFDVTGSDGTSTVRSTTAGTGTEVTSKVDFCKQNPTHPACKNLPDSSFGGTCNAGFTCNGDAAMCATAKAVNDTNCALSKTSAESALYDAEKAKTGNQTTALPGNETVALGPGSFSQTNLLGSAQCIPDLTVTVMSKTLVLPFSDVCPWLEHLGNLLVSVSLLASIRIVSRG